MVWNKKYYRGVLIGHGHLPKCRAESLSLYLMLGRARKTSSLEQEGLLFLVTTEKRNDKQAG
jgi:hypothetical protein